ncbi:alpha/beta fold hydrolase [Luteimonas sp. WGS1318]|uniref:alpha/beta fold hydrolase n=1 Tax=Luteimonas sp. WGS1318 TaxID=3366815 RepID=UPI00372D7829
MSNRTFDLLLVHGAGGGWEWALWRHVLEARGHRVHAPDLQPAVAGIAATRYADYAQQVRDAVERLPRPRVLIGASLGGLLALDAADRADALVLVNPLPPAPWHAHLPARAWPDVVRWGRDARLSSTRRALADADAATALAAMRQWRDESGAVLRAAYAGIVLARPTVPVLCVASQADDDVPPAVTQALAEAWGAERLVSAATTHVGPLLGADAANTARAVDAWLRRHVPANGRTPSIQ